MPRSYQVVLKRDTKAVFPDRCVFCGRDQPNHSTLVLARDAMRGRNLASGWFTVTAPCHRGCGWVMQLGRVWRFVRTVVAGAVGLVVGFFVFFGTVENLKSKKDPVWEALGVFGFIVAAIAAVVIWEFIFPPRFTVDVGNSSVTYQFRDRDQACQFAEQNGLSVAKRA